MDELVALFCILFSVSRNGCITVISGAKSTVLYGLTNPCPTLKCHQIFAANFSMLTTETAEVFSPLQYLRASATSADTRS